MIKTNIERHALTSDPNGATLVIKYPEGARVCYLSLKGGISKLEIPLAHTSLTQVIRVLTSIRERIPLPEKD